MSESGAAAEELLGELDQSESPGWMKNLIDVANETPDVFEELIPSFDFRGFPELQKRAEAVIQTQALVPRAAQMIGSEITGEIDYSANSRNAGFFREFQIEGMGPAICKLAIRGSVMKLRKMNQREISDRYTCALNESATYLIGELMGAEYGALFPALTLRKTEGRIAVLVEKVGDDQSKTLSDASSVEIDRAALIDSLTLNRDRHRFNYLISPSGELQLIDHEMNFFYEAFRFDDPANSDLLTKRLSRKGGRALTAAERDVVERLINGRRRVICEALIGPSSAKMFFKRAEKILRRGELF